ncbi:hypothetical protein DY000_02030869 [Brassica cretica]|uniref:Uncharacterized protein n=1 Tax=Brassica cretica TaxID=69181 RepID=A0ABQ7DT52_BRACR|nr:hypothetical protein DY000_02030869 [Brassica cretica]
MSDALLDFYHSDFSKARIIKLSEDLGRISALLDHPVDCLDRPAYIQLLTATEQLGRMNLDISRSVTLTRSDLKSLFDCLSTFSVNFVIS